MHGGSNRPPSGLARSLRRARWRRYRGRTVHSYWVMQTAETKLTLRALDGQKERGDSRDGNKNNGGGGAREWEDEEVGGGLVCNLDDVGRHLSYTFKHVYHTQVLDSLHHRVCFFRNIFVTVHCMWKWGWWDRVFFWGGGTLCSMLCDVKWLLPVSGRLGAD